MDELEALSMEAAELDGAQAASSPEAIQAEQAAAAAVTLADENGQAVTMMIQVAVPILGALYPSLPAVYTPEAVGAIAATVGPVLAKHGIVLKDLGGAYKEEIAAAVVCAPIAWATIKAVQGDILAKRKQVGQAITQAVAERPKVAPMPAAPEVLGTVEGSER